MLHDDGNELLHKSSETTTSRQKDKGGERENYKNGAEASLFWDQRETFSDIPKSRGLILNNKPQRYTSSKGSIIVVADIGISIRILRRNSYKFYSRGLKG